MAAPSETKQWMRIIHEMTVKYKMGQNKNWHNIARRRKYHIKLDFVKSEV